MLKFLLWLLLLVLCWPLAILAVLLWPLVWLVLLPFRLIGIAVDSLFACCARAHVARTRARRWPGSGLRTAGAPGQTRTGTPLRETDFKSVASTGFATGARAAV